MFNDHRVAVFSHSGRPLALQLASLHGSRVIRAFHLHYTPTYSSWLNRVERWIGLITQRASRRGSFTSVTDLRRQIERFVTDWNQHPHPFKWTATAESILAKLERASSFSALRSSAAARREHSMHTGAAYWREKSIQRFKDQLRRLSWRKATITTAELIQQFNPVLRGWGAYYKRAHIRTLFHRLDGMDHAAHLVTSLPALAVSWMALVAVCETVRRVRACALD